MLEALQNLDERISPVFSELKHVKQENAGLLNEVTELRQKLKAQDALEAESVRISRRFWEQEQNLQLVLGKLKQREVQLHDEKDFNTKLTYRVQRRDDDIQRRSEQIQKLQKDIDDCNKKVIGFL